MHRQPMALRQNTFHAMGPGTRLNETHKTNGAEKLGVSRKRKRISGAMGKLAGEQTMDFKHIPI